MIDDDGDDGGHTSTTKAKMYKELIIRDTG